MATITVRLDDPTRDEVEELARAKGVTLSELVRDTIYGLLGRGVEMQRPDVPHSMNMTQRRILALQHEILQRLSEDEYDARYHEHQIEMLNGGYTGEYPREFAGVQTELSRTDCELVWDILDMFTVIKGSVARLDQESVEALGNAVDHALTFRGFDFNDPVESRLASYAEYLIKIGKWEALADRFDDEHEGGNSHHRVLPTYRRMLDAFSPIWEHKLADRGQAGLHLTLAELQTILEAWSYPKS